MVMYSTISTNLKFILKSRLVKLESFISIIKRQSITKNMFFSIIGFYTSYRPLRQANGYTVYQWPWKGQ